MPSRNLAGLQSQTEGPEHQLLPEIRPTLAVLDCTIPCAAITSVSVKQPVLVAGASSLNFGDFGEYILVRLQGSCSFSTYASTPPSARSIKRNISSSWEPYLSSNATVSVCSSFGVLKTRERSAAAFVPSTYRDQSDDADRLAGHLCRHAASNVYFLAFSGDV